MPQYKLIGGVCGCLKVFKQADAAYIPEDGTKDQFSDLYAYYSSEDEQFYYVNENNMATALRHSEDATAPSLNGMALFIGLQDNGDGSFTNYNFTPTQLIGYVMGQSIISVTCESGTTINLDNAYSGRNVAMIQTTSQAYNEDDFTQNDTIITMTNGVSFYDGQKAVIIFNS